MTAQDFIYDALRILGFMRAGQTNGPEVLADGLTTLNGMIDAQNIGRGNIFTERIDTWTLTIGKQTYTIGVDPAGILTPDLDAVRPVRLVRANVLLSSGENTVRRKINLLTRRQWSSKAVQNVSGMPIDLYNDMADPLSTYWFYMVPDQAYVIETYSWQQFAAAASLSALIVVPQGYYEYWVYSLAERLGPKVGKKLSAEAADVLRGARAAVQLLNLRSVPARTDSDLNDDHGGLYNWIAGESEPY
jgi:hypothetical protein